MRIIFRASILTESRVRALYISKRFGDYIIGSVVLLLIAEMAVMAWLMTHAIRSFHLLFI